MTSYTFDEYQELARRTQNPNLTVKDRRLHALHGLAGEVGEIHSLYQKAYQGHAILREDLLTEVGDLLWFIAELCDVENAFMSDVAWANIEKLRERYPEGFSAERSRERYEAQ